MTSVFGIAQRYIHIILFVVLEVICLSLVVNYNSAQQQIISNSASQIKGSIRSQTSRINDLLTLEQENAQLSAENASLIREIIELSDQLKTQDIQSDADFQFKVTPAKILSQSIHSQRNKLILNKGQLDSVTSDLGVINYDGLVGKITGTSTNYSTVMSLLNVDCKVSATLKPENYYGTISWPGKSINELILEGIPNHVRISVGDSVVTNGYSTIYPAGVMIGKVQKWELEKSGEFYKIIVKPSVSLTNLDNVFIVNNLSSQEISSL